MHTRIFVSLRFIPILLAVGVFLMAGGCVVQPAQPGTCPSTSIDTIEPPLYISMPMAQLLGRTRQDNEYLFRPQGAPSITGWVVYGDHLRVCYQGEYAVALKINLPDAADLPCEHAAAWAGFLRAAEPTRQGRDCSWAVGQLCYDSRPYAGTWDAETAELNVWQEQSAVNYWWQGVIPVVILVIGWLVLRHLKH